MTNDFWNIDKIQLDEEVVMTTNHKARSSKKHSIPNIICLDSVLQV
jgi:hypothetical protein